MAGTRRTRGPLLWIALGGGVMAIAALFAFGYLVYRGHDRPPADTALPPETQPALSAAPFGPWMRFESVSQHRQHYESLYIDLVLGHQVFKSIPRGLPPQQARALFLDDDDLLLSSGRKLWTRESLPRPGLSGRFCYIHSDFCLKRLFEVYFVIDGEPAVIYDNQYLINRYPSRTLTRHPLGNVLVDETCFVSYDDRAVCAYDLQARDGRAHSVTVHVVAENLTMPQSRGAVRFPLLGAGQHHGRPILVYLDAPGFEELDTYPTRLGRAVNLSPDGASQRVNVGVSFETAERRSTSPALSPDFLEQHVARYQQWFFENVPYFDCPDGAVKRMWYYRWWVVRFNLAEPETPDLQGYVFYEGKLGFDNLISFAAPVQIKELTYLRDPRFALDQARNSYRNVSAVGALVDAPSSPYWGEMYSQWTTAAVAELHRVHPIDAATLRQLLPVMAGDVRAWMREFDADGDFLPSRDIPRITGYDLDILSWWHFNQLRVDVFARPPDLERVDFASFVYANAVAVAELARETGEPGLAGEFSTLAGKIREAVLEKLWDPASAFFYPQRAADDARIPIRELHGFFPFTMRLAPDEPEYREALRKFVDPAEFWARYPPVITSTAHYRQWTWEMDGLTRNIAPHPISMGALTAIRALHDYDQDIIQPRHFMELMNRYTSLMYPGVHPGDPTWRPNAHEYYSEWEPGSRSLRPKPSDISHDFHSSYNVLVIEGMVGLKPRSDGKIELRPSAIEWPHFVLDRLRYRGRDLTIVWDRPDGQVKYQGYPEGLSLYVDGELAFTRPSLARVVYDPGSRTVEPPEE
jgi:hypothetical protein